MQASGSRQKYSYHVRVNVVQAFLFRTNVNSVAIRPQN